MKIKEIIKNDLKVLTDGDFTQNATQLLSTLGYKSDRKILYSGEPSKFFTHSSTTQSRRSLLENMTSLKLVFQLTNEEISHTSNTKDLFDSEALDEANADSFYFVTAELKPNKYSRTKYVEMTREINKRYEKSPAVVLFRVDNFLTIAFASRRSHKRDETRDVLGKVTLVKDIYLKAPHRAHLDILSELALTECKQWITDNNKKRNFDGLLEAWLSKLDTEVLNKRFYKELFGWFNRAVKECRFPDKEKKTLSRQEHIIRLITRMLFIWFIKEKGLIAPELFNERKVRGLLKDYDPDEGDSYYRAVLQNLFFATLNTEIKKRGFSEKTNKTHRDFSRYRYKAEMTEPDRLLGLFAKTPFINGGLFDCLDSFEGQTREGYRIDCFSDVHYKKLSIPNNLFFGARGLIQLLESYKFTVEESTPLEQEVALDPELLGEVFENLLAAHNPETGEIARKKTGSYYTPRPVVDYMVDEALVAYLMDKVQPDNGDKNDWQGNLRCLLDYAYAFNDANDLLSAKEQAAIVHAIAEIKVLDPAVGSGAFPMGILHKLTLALRRLDPSNELWEELQKERAVQRAGKVFETADQRKRDQELKEISSIFELYKDSDFGRKLYLIQNNIFGVDIQAIACQIAKLRFFISLAIEQEANMRARVDNYGIKPLPNLETRFVVANTLRGLGERILSSEKGQKLERELYANRERYFHATTRKGKLSCVKQDKKLRDNLAKDLKKTGMSTDDTDKIVGWNPYDQNTKSDWFDAEYMFGVIDGFDVVISNPPYLNIEKIIPEMRKYLLENYQYCQGRTDIYIAFLEKSLSILNRKGLMCFILSAAFTKEKYGTQMRQALIDEHFILKLVDASGYKIFENAQVSNIILAVTKDIRESHTEISIHRSNADFEGHTGGQKFFVNQSFFASLKDSRFDTNPNISNYIKIKEKIWQNSICFDQICFIAYGARLNHRDFRKKIGKDYYLAKSPTAVSKKFCEGRNIERYLFSQDSWLNYMPNEHYNPMFPELFENEKLMFIRIVKHNLRVAYDNQGFYNSHTVINCVRLDLLSGVSHRTVIRAIKCADIELAKKYDYKFLLAILNSRLVNWYFSNFLADGTNCYPNYVKELPIPKVSIIQQKPFIHLVNSIMKKKSSDPLADTSEQEAKIDHHVYKLYGLTTKEVAAIKN